MLIINDLVTGWVKISCELSRDVFSHIPTLPKLKMSNSFSNDYIKQYGKRVRTNLKSKNFTDK